MYVVHAAMLSLYFRLVLNSGFLIKLKDQSLIFGTSNDIHENGVQSQQTDPTKQRYQ